MSAFMVEDKTINKIVTKLAYDRNGDWIKRKVLDCGYDVNSLQDRQKLGWDMFSLNIRSVNQRYDDHPADTFRPLNYKFALEGNYTKIHVLKALKCWLYQSCEGDCDQSPLYKLMDEIANAWAYNIVSDMPEYDTAQAWA